MNKLSTPPLKESEGIDPLLRIQKREESIARNHRSAYSKTRFRWVGRRDGERLRLFRVMGMAGDGPGIGGGKNYSWSFSVSVSLELPSLWVGWRAARDLGDDRIALIGLGPFSIRLKLHKSYGGWYS